MSLLHNISIVIDGTLLIYNDVDQVQLETKQAGVNYTVIDGKITPVQVIDNGLELITLSFIAGTKVTRITEEDEGVVSDGKTGTQE